MAWLEVSGAISVLNLTAPQPINLSYITCTPMVSMVLLLQNGILAEEDGNMEDSKSFYKQALVFNPRAVDARVRLVSLNNCLKISRLKMTSVEYHQVPHSLRLNSLVAKARSWRICAATRGVLYRVPDPKGGGGLTLNNILGIGSLFFEE